MPLVLTLHRARDPADRQRETRTVEEGRLTIGRSPGNDWVLLDPAQHLSKTHCVVSLERGRYVLTDCSSNGVFLNGSKQRLARDSQTPIGDGDEFTLGDYLIQVREMEAARGATPSLAGDDPFGLDEFFAAPPARQAAPPPRPGPAAPRHDPFADPDGQARVDPFGDGLDDLLAPTPGPGAAAAAGGSVRSGTAGA